MRLKVRSFLICAMFFAAFPILQAENQVHIYIPANSSHGEQELRAGIYNDIYIEITADQSLSGIYLELIERQFPNVTSQEYWNDLNNSNLTYLLDGNFLRDRSAVFNGQQSIWPDTLGFIFSETTPSNYLPSGTYSLLKLTVFPIRTGTISITDDILVFIDNLGQNITPSLVSDPITIIEGYDCDGNGIEDYEEISDNYHLDCDENGVLDICESFEDCNNNGIADGCDFDCNINGIPDECESMTDCNCNGVDDLTDISSGQFPDLDSNSIPDECDALPDYYYRVVVAPNSKHGNGIMYRGYSEEIRVFAFTEPGAVISASVLQCEFESSTNIDLWNFTSGENLTSQTNFVFQGLNYYDSSPNNADSLQVFSISIGNDYISDGYFEVAKINVVATDEGIITVHNYLDPINNDSSLFMLPNSQLLYVPVISDNIIVSKYPDCNQNGILDSIDILNGMLADCNNNYIADNCEVDDFPDTDCDNNGLIDICEIESDPTLDCNNNFQLDICEVANDPSLDCNQNNSLDQCDLLYGSSEDCNLNMIPDECEFDCNLNGIPDDCESMADCNCNNVADNLDISSGWSNDTDNNQIPDECEGKAGNYLRIYALSSNNVPSNSLGIQKEYDLIFALTNVPSVQSYLLPLEISNHNSQRIWEAITDSQVTYLHKDFYKYSSLNYLVNQNGVFPDSVLFSLTFTDTSNLFPPNKTLPFIKLSVTPDTEGLVSFTGISLLPFSEFLLIDGTTGISYPLSLIADTFIVGCCNGIRGNIDDDEDDTIDIADIVYLVDYQFGNPTGPAPFCFNEADVDVSGELNIGDLVYLVAYQFQGSGQMNLCQ